MNKNTGFTLIELLFVVLIIGILSAIALPQYQAVVMKSKLTKCMSLARTLADAEERYYMANGEYTLYFSDLDVSIPEGYTSISEPVLGHSQVAYYKGFSVRPKSNLGNSFCILSDLQYAWRLSQSTYPYQNFCVATTSNSTAVKVCKSFGGKKYAENEEQVYYGW